MFSVVIPYYKKRKYIERCINSVLAQIHTDYEIIMVDDGSDDDLKELIVNKYSGKIKLIQQENQGVSAARNTGIAASNHEYIAFLDADDSWSPFFLEKVAAVIKKETDIKIIGCHYTRNKSCLETDVHPLQYFKFENYFRAAIRNTYFSSSSTIIKKSFFRDNPGFNTSLKYGEDLDVWFRAILDGGNAFFIDNTLVYYSDEDNLQATNVNAKLSDALSYHILDYYQPYLSDNTAFKKFASKLLYMSLYSDFFSKDNHSLALSIVKKIPHKFILAELYYRVPFCINNKLINTMRGKKYARNYMKFLFRFIYK